MKKTTKAIKSITWDEYAPVAISKWYEVDGLTSKTVKSQQAIFCTYWINLISI